MSHVMITIGDGLLRAIEVDGQRLLRVVSAVLDLGEPGEHAMLTVKFHVPSAEVHGDLAVQVDEATYATLTALGWSPPGCRCRSTVA